MSKNKRRILCCLFFAFCLTAVFLVSGCNNSDDEAIVMVSAQENDGAKKKDSPKPDDVKLVLDSYGSKIIATWDEAKNASGYELYLSKNGKSYSSLITTNTLSYETDKLKCGEKYYIKIVPYNSESGKNTSYGSPTVKSIVCSAGHVIDGYEVGDTYIHIDIDEQTVRFYKDDKLIVETPVVTGTAGACDTPTGYFEVRKMASPAHLIGPTWDVNVKYWVGINLSNDIGLHDSSWRDSGYGGDIYRTDGSNGCINTPLDAMKKIYDNVTIGVPVIISGSESYQYSNDDYSYNSSSDDTQDAGSGDDSNDIYFDSSEYSTEASTEGSDENGGDYSASDEYGSEGGQDDYYSADGSDGEDDYSYYGDAQQDEISSE